MLQMQKHIRQFHEKCSNIPESPACSDLMGNMVAAPFYYRQNFQRVQSLWLKFDTKEVTVAKANRLKFPNPQVKTDSQTIFNMSIVVETLSEKRM